MRWTYSLYLDGDYPDEVPFVEGCGYLTLQEAIEGGRLAALEKAAEYADGSRPHCPSLSDLSAVVSSCDSETGLMEIDVNPYRFDMKVVKN